MSTTIRLKHSSEAGKVPADLAPGEVGINTADEKAYIKNAAGDIVQLAGKCGGDGEYVKIAGDDMTGNLTLGTDKITLDHSSGAIDSVGKITSASTEDADPDGTCVTKDYLKSQLVDSSGDDIYVKVAGDDMTGNLTLGTDKITLDASGGNIDAAGDVTIENLQSAGFLATDSAGKIIGGTGTPITSVVGGTQIDVTTNGSEVTIDCTAETLVYRGTVDLTVAKAAKNTSPLKQELFLNTGNGTIHATWGAVITNAEAGDPCYPGDYVVFNQTNYDLISAGAPPSSDSLWVESSGNLYPATLTNKVGIGTESPSGLLHLSGGGIAESWYTANDSGGATWRVGTGDNLSGLGGGYRIYDATNSATRFFINALGNAGLGTTVPKTNLDVAGRGQILGITNNVAGDERTDGAYIGYFHNTVREAYFGFANTGKDFYVTNEIPGGNTRLVTKQSDGTLNGEALVVNSIGSVGIGTGSPQAILNVLSTGVDSDGGGEIARFTRNVNGGLRGLKVIGPDNKGSGVGLQVDSTTSPFFVANQAGTRNLNVLDNGNLGIGVPTPAYKLDVAGDLNATNYRIDKLAELS